MLGEQGVTAKGYRVSLWGDEHKTDCGDGRTTL